MLFKDFINKLSSVISAGGSTDKFTKSIFGAILTEEGQDILDEYKSSSYKGFFNGNTSISGISKKVNAYLEPMNFSGYIAQFPDATIQILCTVFRNDISDIDAYNAGDKLAELFVSIITEAASTKKKKSTPKGAQETENNPLGAFSDIAPELTADNAGSIFFIDPVISAELKESKDEDNTAAFDKYLNAAVSYFSTKKTLLYAENRIHFMIYMSATISDTVNFVPLVFVTLKQK